MFVNVGMWLERFVIIVTSLHRDFLPSSWEMYYPTIWDFMTLAGTIGLFTTLMFLFVRVLPMISIFEMRTLLPEAQPKHDAGRRVALMAHATTATDAAVYGLMAEFDSAAGAARRGAQRSHAAGYTKTDAYSPFPIHGLAEALGFKERAGRADRPRRRHHRRARRLRPRVLDAGHRLPDEHRRPAVPLVGVVHPAGVRDDDSVRRVHRGVRHARAERPAAAVSPGLQRAARSSRASQDKFFLAIEAADPKFELDATRAVPAGPASARGGGR